MAETTNILRKISLFCGILSSMLYVATDILGGITWGNYDFASQYISELSAIGAPSRSLVVPLYFLYNILVAAFLMGVWRSAGGKHTSHIMAGLLLGYMASGIIGLFFPMNPGEAATSLSNAMHQILAGVTVIFILLSLGVGAKALGKRFGIYSVGTIVVYLVLGALPFLGVAQIEEGLPTPWVGVVERIMVYGYMLWLAVLACFILRREQRFV
ncbi:MAG: DUF998 domain-containing protein [Promethearchaeota archaeon]